MTPDGLPAIRGAEIVLPAADLDATLAFFTEELGFRVESVFPADAPRVVVVSGHGLRVRLDREATGDAGLLVLRVEGCDGERTRGELRAPNATRIRFEAADATPTLPPVASSFVLTRAESGAHWITGRAGMQYRDLIPDRQGGRFIASHIRIPHGGPVPDYVHYHEIAFQLIYCRRGWVRVVYEDQGPPFVMEAGDCVLQPPEIRHRVLECSDGLEVVEVSCPAEHVTRADHALELPTVPLRPERILGRQRFVRHRASEARWQPGSSSGFEARDTGIGVATSGVADVHVVRATNATPRRAAIEQAAHDGELLFLFVLEGSVELQTRSHGVWTLDPGDSVVVPPAEPYALASPAEAVELLEVRVAAGDARP